MSNLRNECDEERSLRNNYDCIVKELNHLNTDIDFRAQKEITVVRPFFFISSQNKGVFCYFFLFLFQDIQRS